MRGTDNAALAATALSNAQWTNTRAGYLDNLSGGAVALQSTSLAIAGYIDTEVGTLIAAVSALGSPLQAGSYTAPDNSGISSAASSAASAATSSASAATASAAVKVVTDKLATMIEADGMVYQYTTNSLENGASGGGGGPVIITPIQSTLGNGETVSDSGRLVAFQFRRFGPFTITVVDANRDPIDCLVLVATDALSKDGLTRLFKIEMADGITVSGSDDNVITIDADETVTDVPCEFTWTITDKTTKSVRARGTSPTSQIKVAASWE